MSRRTVSASVSNSCERIRPERARNPIQRLVWAPGSRFQLAQVGPIDDEASNPRMALRRLLRLYEGRQYREAAAFLTKLPASTLKASLPDIPVDLLIETLPASLSLLEALYARLRQLNVNDATILRVEQVLWRIVHLISASQEPGRSRIWRKLLVSLNGLAPTTGPSLLARKRALERAVEGLAGHGLVAAPGTPPGAAAARLLPLPAALRGQLETRIDAYKLAVHKIESFAKHAGSRKAEHGVQAASHQRQLSLKYSEIQQRLIDNQSLLNTLEKAGDPAALETLLSELKRRVEQDKEALRQWTGLRKSSLGAGTKNPALAARLLQFSRGCELALQLMAAEDDLQVFEPGEAIPADDCEEESSGSAGYHTDESCSPTPEPVLATGREILRPAEGRFPDGCSGDASAARLAERYAALYGHAHFHTMDALDALQPLDDAPDFKAKILYSVLVLSWRLAGAIQTSRYLEAVKILNGGGNGTTAVPELEECVKRQLATSGARTGCREVAEQAVEQVQRTLHDFPCLRGCGEIKEFAAACADLAWACLARSSPLVLDAAQTWPRFCREIHSRHRASPNPNGTRIKTVLWPGLRQGCRGPWLRRAIVLTL